MTISDYDILYALIKSTSPEATYVIANRLREKHLMVTTDQIRRRLSRMERDGRVARVPTNYAGHISWRVA